MKKFTILFFIISLVFSVNAQKQIKLKAEKAPNYKMIIDNNDFYNPIVPFNKAVGGVPIGSSQNIYSVLLSGNQQVMYNSDLNTVVFVHRALNSGAGSSGELSYDFSTNGGASWTTEAYISPGMDHAGALCRYPSISIYNPTSNTDIANARIVANGPALISGSSWGKSFEIDATISGTPAVNDAYISNNGDDTDFHPMGLEMGSDGTAWSVSIGYDGINYLDNVYVNKAVYNSGTDKFDWTSPLFTITPDYKYTGDDRLFNDWDIAVDPSNPDIVYAIVGCLETGDAVEVPTPHVWKTTNGGADWTALDPIDFTAEPFATTLDAYIIYNDGEPMKPYVTDFDATVDANGTLHLFSTVYSGAADIGYIYGLGDATQSYRHYIDFTTTDGTDWAMQYINDIECEAAAFGDVSTYMHPQIGRNESGTDVVYMWSETFADTDSLNTAPNMMAAVWNTSQGLVSDSLNLTAGTGAQGICYFPQTSPVVIDKGDGTLELPIVIPMINFASGSDLDQANYLYITDVSILAVDVDELVSKTEVIVYPNPVYKKVFVSVGAKVEMFNILGARLLTVEGKSNVTTIDLSNYPRGTYLLKVYTEKGIVTKKIQKK